MDDLIPESRGVPGNEVHDLGLRHEEESRVDAGDDGLVDCVLQGFLSEEISPADNGVRRRQEVGDGGDGSEGRSEI